MTAVGFVLEAVTRRSPLLIRLRSESAFSPPCDFKAHTPDPRYVQLVHPRELDIDGLVEGFAGRWPRDQVRVRRRKSGGGVRVLAGPLDGSLSIAREGDERTWFRVSYDQSRAALAEAIVAELLRHGVHGLRPGVIGRTGPADLT